MAFVDTTFFGEVSDLRSRAVWEDSDEDEDQVTDAGDGQLQISCELNELAAVGKLDVLFVTSSAAGDSSVKSSSSKLLGSIKVIGSGKTLATVYRLSGTTAWLVLDSSPFKINESQLIGTVQRILREIRSLVEVSLITIVTKQLPTNGEVQFLTNTQLDKLPFPKSLLQYSLTPPAMVTEPTEATIFEYCALNALACCLFALPDERLYNFDVSTVDLPKELIGSLVTNHMKADNFIYA